MTTTMTIVYRVLIIACHVTIVILIPWPRVEEWPSLRSQSGRGFCEPTQVAPDQSNDAAAWRKGAIHADSGSSGHTDQPASHRAPVVGGVGPLLSDMTCVQAKDSDKPQLHLSNNDE